MVEQLSEYKHKDPAFLFYPGDFLVDCANLTLEERGQYITLICLQHQHGHLPEKTISLSVGILTDDVTLKFAKDENGNFYNERLDEVIKKRKEFTESRRQNGLKGGRPKKPSAKPSENLSRNRNRNETKTLTTGKRK